MRVHELAKELGRDVVDVLRTAPDIGLYVRSAASVLTDDDAERLRVRLSGTSRSARSHRSPLARNRPSSARPDKVSVSEVFKGDPDAVLMARKLGVSFVPEQRGESQQLTGTAQLLRSRYPQLSAAEARRHAVEWTRNMMDEETVAGWLDVGLGPTDHATVAALSGHGVRPKHLNLTIDGQRVGAMIRGGASATRVVGLLRTHGHI